MSDAVVIGSGPNGLVAANLLADAGWSVSVLEAAKYPGGAVRSAQVTSPGFVNDLCSAFYPLAAASPVIAGLQLHEWGVRWTHAPAVVAHPLGEGRAALLSRDVATTAASVDALGPGDGAAWTRVVEDFQRIRGPLLETLFRPFPPAVPAAQMLRRLGVGDALRFARFATLPVRRWTDEVFTGAGAASLIAGHALHTDLGPESAGGAAFGWLLCMLGQTVGFPVPVGGAQALTDGLVARLRARGGALVCGAAVTQVLVRAGRALGVRTALGEQIPARRAVVAAVDAPQLYGLLLRPEELPARLLEDLRRFQWDHATLKVDWALSGPIPWTDEASPRAGTVHVGGALDELSRFSNQLARGVVPDRPLVVLGQMTTTDPSRSPAGTESAWAYTHVPQRPRADAGAADIGPTWDDRAVAAVVDRMEGQIERFAPGFRDRVVARHVMGPLDLESKNRSLVRGALNGGSAALYQQLVWRPVPGLGRPETPVRGLYLASASAHPGGGVHGAPGALAARVALRDAGPLGPLRGAAVQAMQRAVYR